MIFPFSIHKKIVLILFKDREIFVRKIAFENSKNLLYNEYRAMEIPLISQIAPKVIQYYESNNISYLDIEFVKGNHIKNTILPEEIINFFKKLYAEYSQGSFYPSEHPYILHMLYFIESKLKLLENDEILENWHSLKERIMNLDKKFLLTAMHGDFTRTNLMVDSNSSIKILDWEYFSTSGINIDLDYFFFRIKADSKISPLKKGLVNIHLIESLYYIYFLLKNVLIAKDSITSTLNKFL